MADRGLPSRSLPPDGREGSTRGLEKRNRKRITRLTPQQIRSLAEALYLRSAWGTNRYMAELENRRAHPPLPFKMLSAAEQKHWRDGVTFYMSEALKQGWSPPPG